MKYKLYFNISNFIKINIKNLFVRNVASIISGSIFSQGISLIFSVIITRLYGPDAFGLQNLFMSFVGFFEVIVALGYPNAIVLAKNDNVASIVIKISIIIGLAFTIFTSFIIFLFGDYFLKIFGAESLKEYLFLIPVCMIISVFGSVINQSIIRNQKFKFTAKIGVINTTIINLSKSIQGAINPSAKSLIMINIVGSMINVLTTYVLWNKRYPDIKILNFNKLDFSKTMLIFKEYSDFATLVTPRNLINFFSLSLPIFLLSSYFNPSISGQYALAVSVIGLPFGLIGNGVSSVIYPKLNLMFTEGYYLDKFIKKITIIMILIGVIPFFVIFLYGDVLFNFIFGEKWGDAGKFAQLLAPLLFAYYINIPISSAAVVIRLNNITLFYEIINLITRVLSIYLGYYYFLNPIYSIFFLSASGILNSIFMFTFLYNKIKY